MNMIVSIVDPRGDVAKIITCKSARQCQRVIDTEAKLQPPYTIFSVTGLRGDRTVAVDRWGIDPKGRLRHAPYRRNGSDDDLFGPE